MDLFTNVYLGDSRKVLTKIPDNSVDLIFTSPPYADRRKNTYGGAHIVSIFILRCVLKEHESLN